MDFEFWTLSVTQMRPGSYFINTAGNGGFVEFVDSELSGTKFGIGLRDLFTSC